MSQITDTIVAAVDSLRKLVDTFGGLIPVPDLVPIVDAVTGVVDALNALGKSQGPTLSEEVANAIDAARQRVAAGG